MQNQKARTMKLSKYFLPILRDTPKEAEIASHRLMLRAGMIRQQSAGIYSWLPLGYKVLQKVENLIREEQNRAGAIELKMPTIQSADLWRESGRYDDYGKEMLRIKDRHERDMLFGPTNEEMITEIFRGSVKSYKDLPLNLYHIQLKFRDEVRPRFGVMRSREFVMKDAYSFDMDEAAAVHSYNKMFVAYLRTFARMGLKPVPVMADTGPIGGNLSHEFVILADTGETRLFAHKGLLEETIPPASLDYDNVAAVQEQVTKWTQRYAATDEKGNEAEFHAAVSDESARIEARGIEVGHIFYFGTKYSAAMNAQVQMPDGKLQHVHMGSYGIGPTRLVAAIIEALHDENGIVWPASIAPFHVALLNLKVGDAATDTAAQEAYAQLTAAGLDVLYDDTQDGPGAKFKTADLIGLPVQVIIGPKGLAEGKVELKIRKTGERVSVAPSEVVKIVQQMLKNV